MKKLLSLTIVLAMVFALAIPAIAADENNKRIVEVEQSWSKTTFHCNAFGGNGRVWINSVKVNGNTVTSKEYSKKMSDQLTFKAVGGTTQWELVNGKNRISAEMALKLAKAFNVEAQFWLNMQTQYDLWQAKQRVNLDNVQVVARN